MLSSLMWSIEGSAGFFLVFIMLTHLVNPWTILDIGANYLIPLWKHRAAVWIWPQVVLKLTMRRNSLSQHDTPDCLLFDNWLSVYLMHRTLRVRNSIKTFSGEQNHNNKRKMNVFLCFLVLVFESLWVETQMSARLSHAISEIERNALFASLLPTINKRDKEEQANRLDRPHYVTGT